MKYYLLITLFFCWSCENKKANTRSEEKSERPVVTTEDSEVEAVDPVEKSSIHDSSFINLSTLSNDFIFDLKYASEDNFLKESVYDCGDCFLRYKVAKALIVANKVFMEKGYKIKLYDCYRPLRVQKKMWAKVPDAKYVADPYNSSSYHNRGCAVDLTLTDLDGNELDMGTPFDFFGTESHYAYPGVSNEIRLNRDLLREVLESAGFKGIRTEWWHFSIYKYPVSDEDMCK